MLQTIYWHAAIMVSEYQYCRLLSNQQDECNMIMCAMDLLTGTLEAQEKERERERDPRTPLLPPQKNHRVPNKTSCSLFIASLHLS